MERSAAPPADFIGFCNLKMGKAAIIFDSADDINLDVLVGLVERPNRQISAEG